jgi:DNA helicase-2/ATP-dependent DNA helicase PcrA
VLKLIPGIGPVMAARTLDALAASSHQFSALKAVGNKLPTLNGYSMTNDKGRLWIELVELMCLLSNEDQAWHGQMEQVRKWYQPVLELNYNDHFVRNGDIEQLEMIGGQYTNRQQFLAELTLDPPVMSGDLAGAPHLDDDFLILSTIHSAKGQEWKNVFILNVNDGNFPNEFACGDAGRIEEERRLLYVAMTRAKESLSLIRPLKYWVPEQTRHGDKHVYGAKSRFLTPTVMKYLRSSSFGDIHTDKPSATTCGNTLMDVRSRAASMFQL